MEQGNVAQEKRSMGRSMEIRSRSDVKGSTNAPTVISSLAASRLLLTAELDISLPVFYCLYFTHNQADLNKTHTQTCLDQSAGSIVCTY